jgi:hypothetical protein
MNWYARFRNDVKDESGKVILKANIKKSKKTRYAIIDQDNEYYYVANVANDINCGTVLRVKKIQQKSLFDMVQE